MTLVWAILFLVGGFVLRFQINKRQFNRRNAAGVEEFKSYGNAYGIQIMEKIGRWVGLFLIITGIFFAVSFFFDGSHK
ncbi:molybdenum ABC transporter permease [Mucilaginibacter terrae]|uniref:molybdenum ABC transporter permease n=1 Tax=Mucilaginibacter terrae TaxID=1955052 RepID=UPI0036458DA5